MEMSMRSNLYSTLPFLPLIFAQTIFGGGEQPEITEKIALYSKPSVVRIFSGCSGTYTTAPEFGNFPRPYTVGNVGTGFFINSEGYILTSAHVVQASQEGENGCKERLFENLVRDLTGEDPQQVDSARKDNIKRNSVLENDFIYFQHVFLPNSTQSDADALRFDIKEIGTVEPGTGKDIAVIKIQLTNTPVLGIGDSGDVRLGDDVIAIGYPASGDRQDEFDDGSIVEAGIFEGNISKINATLKDNTRVLELDISVGYGSSGSPVLNKEGKVVGMLTFDEVQAFNQVFQGNATPLANRTNSLLEYVRQAGVTNEPGEIDILYRDGLDFLWGKNLEGARTKLESVQDLFPQHSEVGPLLQEVRSDLAELNTVQRNYAPLIMGIIGGGFLLGISYWLFSKKSSKSQTVPPVQESFSTSLRQLPSESQVVPKAFGSKKSEIRQATVVSTDPYIELKNQSGRKHYLYLKQQVHTIGRDSEWSDIKRIPDDGWAVISRRQATLVQEGLTYRIYDGDKKSGHPSSNGIFIDNQPIDEDGYVLRNGDCLVIGGDPRTQVYMTYYNPDLD
jgi:serine protease Do